MRKFLFLLLLSGSSLAGFAQHTVKPANVLTADDIQKKGGIKLSEMAQTANPFTLSRRLDKEQMNALAKQHNVKNTQTANAAKPKRVLQRAEGKVDTVQYFSAVQSYYSGYSFNAAGGDVFSYDLGIAVEGTKVTFNNLFQLYDPTSYSPSVDYPVVGTYDAEAKTITIPTKSNFAEATIAGKFYNYYPAVLMCGTINSDGKLAPDNELVFTVEGDFDYITTDQAVCAFMYTVDGSQSYGVQEAFKKMHIQKPTAGAKLVTMSDELSIGKAFPNKEISKTFSLVNLGNDAAEFAAETEADDNSTFTIDPFTGSVAGQGIQTVNVTFSGTKAGDYEGVSTFEWEGSESAEPFMVTYTGTVLDYPDYSEAVKNGDFEITTDIDYPFFMDELADGTPIAVSNTQGKGNASSKLYVKFNVPEGKMGKFSWKGVSTNQAYWYYNAGGVFVDDVKFSAFTETADISDAIELAPGEHTVRFQYDSYYYTGVEANNLYVYDLDLELTDLPADAAELKTTSLDLGQFICEPDVPATGSATISIVNKGSNLLTVKSATIDGSVFIIDQNFGSAPTMQTVDITLNMEASKAGEYSHTATLVTSAGTFTVPVKALVRDMPDFQSIVKEGTFTFTTTPEHPWLVENGVAYNSTAKVPDYTYCTASFTASFTVPEGKLGIISWDGEMNSKAPANPEMDWTTNDYGLIEFQHPMQSGTHAVAGGVHSASSAEVYGSDEYWADFLYCVPGEHWFKFSYLQIGDSIYGGEDKMSIKNLSLRLIDYDEHQAELQTKSVKFDSTFVGYNRYTTAKVTLKNVGSKALKVLDIPQAGAFYGVIPTDSAQFLKTLDVTLWFFPTAVGDYKDSLTIKTNAGDFKVACEGVAKSSEPYVYVGDLEDDAYAWTYYDADGDGECWNLGSNLFGGEYPEYCHSGVQCLGSASYSYYNGDITPDNWLFSPQITIPEEGAVLTWAAAEQSKKRAGDYYSVYVDLNENMGQDNLANLTPVFSETLDSTTVDRWAEHSYDLSSWAGKTIVVAFRHHNCTGNYLIRLDDVFVWKKDAFTGITSAKGTDKRVARQEYFDLTGKRLAAPTSGINIVRTIYADGSCSTTKALRK